MSSKREFGGMQPGIKWGPFVMRIPFVHMKFSLPDFLQGFAISGATGLALVPIMQSLLGLSFEEAVTMAMFHSLLVCSSFLLFGDPYAPGWLTPAIPFVINFIMAAAPADHPDLYQIRFQAMTALAIDFAIILIFLGVTGLGAKLVKVIPDVFKGGIILGAAVAAFIRVTTAGDSANVFEKASIAGTIGVAICLIFAFSKPLQEKAATSKGLAIILGLGLLPGFIVAGLIGYFTGEFQYNIQWSILNFPETTVSMWEKASPLYIGWPPLEMFAEASVLAFITYILFFGDLVTGDEMIEHSGEARPDEKLDLNNSRAHISVGIRNILMGIFAPFYPTQGVLWTGIQVILLKRWVQGKQKVDSFFDAMGSFYVFGFPILYILLPLVTLLQPLLPLALAVTLILTGFACATLALSLVKDATERGAMVLTAMALGIFKEPWIGMLIGLISIITLCGWQVFVPGHPIKEFGPMDEHEPATEKES
ncbi:MAG: hypothetical protein ACRBCS_14105 [Cellvibrionaceae bacterium]